MKNINKKALILLAVLQSPVQASTIHTELTDAGELLSTAQITQGMGTLDTINASLIDLGNTTDDVDLFKIKIVDPDNFSVKVTADLSEDNDATLYLFNKNGNQVLFNDDGEEDDDLLPEFSLKSLSDFDSDIYYLGISLLFTEPEFSDGSLVGWKHEPDLFQTGDYSLQLSGTEFVAAVPLPSSFLLFGSGLILFLKNKKIIKR